jgi:hypothetical protein
MNKATEKQSPIECLVNGVFVDPATAFGPPNHRRNGHAVGVAFVYAAREALRRTPEVLNVHG